jgi:hypothetical protein
VSKGGVSPSGRALRFVLWRLPLGATKFSIARNTAAVTEEGRRILALIGFGAWVAVFWYVASFLHAAVGLLWPRQLAGLFGLLLIWRIIGLARRWWAHRRNLASMARNAQIQRETFKILTALPGQIQQLARQAPGGGIDMFGAIRRQPQGPATKEEAFQAGQPWTEPPPGMAPLIPWRRLFRRRR